VSAQLPLFHAPRATQIDPAEWKFCRDCGIDTHVHGEAYILNDDVWPIEVDGGALCVGCVELRLDRRLTPADFNPSARSPFNDPQHSSPRLRTRLLGQAVKGESSPSERSDGV
jgi:hypothetical protein